MEKTTKKSKKKSRRLKKRIGIIAVGGLSFVLTICLSVGATLAWFAGSSWASNDLYMGGPVYVEMAGRGKANGTTGSGTNENQTANWVGGAGNLDIKAASTRSSGTYYTDESGDKTTIPDNILLPGQKVQIYSQARVFSTAQTDSTEDGAYPNNSSGANTTNTSKSGTTEGTATYLDGKGRVTTTTTSVLRARFSISVEFDPSVGFNNFTNEDYMEGYPKQSTAYTGEKGDGVDATWAGAMSTAADDNMVWSQDIEDDPESADFGKVTIAGRRDGVDNTESKWTNVTSGADDSDIRSGDKTSIYKWRYVSKTEYDKAVKQDKLAEYTGTGAGLLQMVSTGVLGGTTDSTHTTKAYACYILDGKNLVESDAFYKARTNAYLQSYVEYYENEYGNKVERTIEQSITSLDTALNNDFKRLINDSSDAIQNGLVYGYTVKNGVQTNITGALTKSGAGGGEGGTGVPASWLYIDPSIGNDTNTNEISTSTGGWWYLVSSNGSVAGETDANEIDLVADEGDSAAGGAAGENTFASDGVNTPLKGVKVNGTEVTKAKRGDTGFKSDDNARLYAKLYEISPTLDLHTLYNENYVGKNGTKDVSKVVSVSFPFVNGTFALPGDALTNIFANAKISFQISFQAIQAFFPYTTSIDGLDYKDDLFGVAKQLNIKNAIPIFNEAFDYQESFTNDSASIPL